MSKSFKIVPTTSTENLSVVVKRPALNWNICFLCQKETSEPLVVPDRGKRFAKGTGYRTLAELLSNAQETGFNPLNINFCSLDDGSGIERTLHAHQASWHKLCKNEYSEMKLDRWKKRKAPCHETKSNSDSCSPVKTRRLSADKCEANNNEKCLFCDGSGGTLHAASTFTVDSTVRQCAIQLRDTNLLRKIAGGDLVAIGAKYHKECLTELFNRNKAAQRHDEESTSSLFHSIALAELIAHVDEARHMHGTAPVFRLSDIADTYDRRLADLGENPEMKVNKTRLKERLLANCPYLTATTKGREILFVVDGDVGDAVAKACDQDSDIVCLAKAATIIRKQIFQHSYTFNGNVGHSEQIKSVPSALLALVNMILQGPNINAQIKMPELERNAGLTIAQLLVFNTIQRIVKHSHSVRHNTAKETPLPIYIGLKMHLQTRKRELVDHLHRLGLSISYDRLLRMSASVANNLCKQFEEDGVVCPPELRNGLFTTGQVDNLDHNPSSISAKDSFHGTAHSMCQHPHLGNLGDSRADVSLLNGESSRTKQTRPLPVAYTHVSPAQSLPKDVHVPVYHTPVRPSLDKLRDDRKSEYRWLEEQAKLCHKEKLEKGDCLSWAAYHASNPKTPPHPMTNIALLPLFREKSNSVAMILHIMKNNAAATEFLNPGQVPVLAMDQPLFAIAKHIQWQFPNLYGENKYVIMLGGLHTEMAAMRTIGDLLQGSGWTDALIQADVVNAGTSEGLLQVSHVTKTRRAHQVTAAAYSSCTQTEPTDVASRYDFIKWCSMRSQKYPQFHFWQTVLDFELTIFQFVRSLRTSDFDLYVASQAELVPWFFALDHTNYARWLPVHVRDMASLHQICPAVFQEFQRGSFTAKKTRRHFSAMSLDQAHEQLNALVKGDGGAVGLTENPGGLRRWMIAGPEIARIVEEFEEEIHDSDSRSDRHHEQETHVQQKFWQDVRSVVATIEEMGNPFMEESNDLLSLNNKVIMTEKVAKAMRNMRDLGESQYNTFVEERFKSNSKSISETIPRNKLPVFGKPGQAKTKVAGRVTELKSDRALFSRLYIASQRREGDLDEFFRHENQPSPPSLSSGGQMNQGDKFHLLDCLEKDASPKNLTPSVDATVLDGPAVVHFLHPGTSATFEDYAKDTFVPYVVKELEKVSRIDVVWDVYRPDSLKAATRENRGSGTRRRVHWSTRIPGNWPSFLRNNENKQELFKFLAESCVSYQTDEDKIIYSTYDEKVICSKNVSRPAIDSCTHEEADSRIFVHIQDMVKHGHAKVMIRTVDTDVVVIAVAHFFQLGLEELWVAFGTGKKYRHVAVHEIATSLGRPRSEAMTFFHAFTGCDTVSFFVNHGKKSAWQTWQSFPEATEAFHRLSLTPGDVPYDVMVILERFVVLLYDRTSELQSMDETRRHLFTKRSREIENIPPTSAALLEHTKRAAFQAGHIWGQALISSPTVPSPADWGWEQRSDNTWAFVWSTLPEASKACYELLCCKCQKACRENCKCYRANLQCTSLCACDGQCY